MKKVTVWFVDREWWDNQEKRIVGDMYFTFQERPETVTDHCAELKRWLGEYINSHDEEAEFDRNDGHGGFSIDILYKSTAKVDDGEIFWFNVDTEHAIWTDVYVMADRERAKELNLEEKYKGAKIHYYNGK